MAFRVRVPSSPRMSIIIVKTEIRQFEGVEVSIHTEDGKELARSVDQYGLEQAAENVLKYLCCKLKDAHAEMRKHGFVSRDLKDIITKILE